MIFDIWYLIFETFLILINVFCPLGSISLTKQVKNANILIKSLIHHWWFWEKWAIKWAYVGKMMKNSVFRHYASSWAETKTWHNCDAKSTKSDISTPFETHLDKECLYKPSTFNLFSTTKMTFLGLGELRLRCCLHLSAQVEHCLTQTSFLRPDRATFNYVS